MESFDLVVIGGGPAAITLAKQLGNRMRMAVIRPEDHSMIYCAMPYVLEGILDIKQTCKKDSLVTDSGATLIRSRVVSMDVDAKTVLLEDGTTIGYARVVLATGADPFVPPVPGAGLNGVVVFKTERQLAQLLDAVKSGTKKAVIVGAGAIGVELAQALAAAGLVVDLVDMADAVLPNLVDKEMTEVLAEELLRKGIHLHLGTKVQELRGASGVEQVLLDSGVVVHFDEMDECSSANGSTHNGMVVFAAGMRPSVELVKGSRVDTGRDGIVVNDRMETSVPDVYAVGDCVQFVSGINGMVMPGKLATNAVPMARVLSDNLTGGDRRYPGFFNGAATRVGDWYVGGTGFSERFARAAGYGVVTGYSEVTTQFPIMPGARKMRYKLVADAKDGRLLGAQLVSGEPVTGHIDLLTFAIQKRTLVRELLDLSYSSQPYQSFYPASNGIIMAAEQVLAHMVS